MPARVAKEYAAALTKLPLEPCPVDDDEVWAVPSRLASVEYFLRLTRGRNGLTQRFAVVFYLAELEPGLFPRFARTNPSWLSGFVELGRAGLSSPLSLARGAFWFQRVRRA